MLDQRKQAILYWIATALLIVPMGAGGVGDIMQPEMIAKTFAHLGYPEYFAVMLGIGKILGIAVVLAPGLPRAKEWAYAGMTIDLVAALVSHVAVDGVTKDAVPPVVFLAVVFVSWALRPASRKL